MFENLIKLSLLSANSLELAAFCVSVRTQPSGRVSCCSRLQRGSTRLGKSQGKMVRKFSILTEHSVNQQGNTPLHLAAGWGDLQCVTLVLEGGADVRRQSNIGHTPLEVAVSLARKDHIRLLKDWKPLGLSSEGLCSSYSDSTYSNEILTSPRCVLKQS